MSLLISVPYTIMEDQGISESNPREGGQAKVKFKCLWIDHYQLIRDLMWGVVKGTPIAGAPGTGGIGFIQRTGPLHYPPAPGLRCSSIESVEPIGKPMVLNAISPQWLVKEYAIVTAVFSWIPWADPSDPSGQPYTQTSIGIAGEALLVPGQTFTVGGVQTNIPLAIMVPQMEVSYKRFFMPYIPIAEIAYLAGKVNGSLFFTGDCSFPISTLLFVGGNSEVGSDTQGNVTQTVEYKFMFRNNPNWNQNFTPSMTIGAISPQPYAFGDFSILP